jgi:hypothetical protein
MPDADPPPYAYLEEDGDDDGEASDEDSGSSGGNAATAASSSSSAAAAAASSSSSAAGVQVQPSVTVCDDCGWGGHKSKRAYSKCPMAAKYVQKAEEVFCWGGASEGTF